MWGDLCIPPGMAKEDLCVLYFQDTNFSTLIMVPQVMFVGL